MAKPVECPICHDPIMRRFWAIHVEKCRREAAKAKPMAISEEDLALHNILLEMEASANGGQRGWAPFRKIETLFRRSFTKRDGQTYNAADYGYRAFRFEVKGKHTNQTRTALQNRPKSEPLKPIISSRRLRGGFAAGDRIRHDVFGPGVILSIAPSETIFQFNTGLKSIPTAKAHHYIVKLKRDGQ